MDIKNLPGGGSNFRVSAGVGNFTKKFSSAVRYGDLRNLADNKKAILGAVKKYEGAIRIGKFDRLRRLNAYNQIKKAEGNKLTKNDREEIKQVLKHLGPNANSGRIEKVLAAPSSTDFNPIVNNRVQRANVLRYTRDYEEARKLGSGATARQIQMKAFEKLKKAGGDVNNTRFSNRLTSA